MSDTLKHDISKLDEIFKRSVTKLKEYCISRANGVIKSTMAINVKKSIIDELKTYYYKAYNELKTKFFLELQKLKTEYLNNPFTATAPSIPTPNKKALLIGINYKGTKDELLGCINDVDNVAGVLKAKCGFSDNDIDIMTDETYTHPTKKNILKKIKNLLVNAVAGDILFLLYSGHGSIVDDENLDESSGFDSVIVGVDFNYISDDELKTILDDNLKKDVSLFAMFDSCNSGTVMDLPYVYTDIGNSSRYVKNTLSVETAGLVIMISGSTDEQTSSETPNNSGALTTAFLSAFKNTSGDNTMTCAKLFTHIRDWLKDADYTQTPQISSSKQVDLDNIVFFAQEHQ